MGFKPSKMASYQSSFPSGKCNVSFADIYNNHPNATSVIITNDDTTIHKFIFLSPYFHPNLYIVDNGTYLMIGPVKNMTMPIFAKHIQVYLPNSIYSIAYC